MGIGPDGKPQPMESILQLQDHIGPAPPASNPGDHQSQGDQWNRSDKSAQAFIDQKDSHPETADQEEEQLTATQREQIWADPEKLRSLLSAIPRIMYFASSWPAGISMYVPPPVMLLCVPLYRPNQTVTTDRDAFYVLSWFLWSQRRMIIWGQVHW